MKRNFDALAREKIVELLSTEHAVLRTELEARLSEVSLPEAKNGINPHVISRVIQRMLAENVLAEDRSGTRGGGTVNVLHLANTRKIKTKIDHASQRKRLLQARYRSWGTADEHRPNLIGEGGETMFAETLAAANRDGAGYRLAPRTRGEVHRLFGQDVPGGPLDQAGSIALETDAGPVVVTTAFEVKNLREWIYPKAHELYQLLDKAAKLQQAHPHRNILPVFICRRSQWLAFTMAKDLGFIILHTYEQALLPHDSVSETWFNEVVTELGYSMTRNMEANRSVLYGLVHTIPATAIASAVRWRATAPVLGDFFTTLRNDRLADAVRYPTLAAMKEASRNLLGTEGDWCRVRRNDDEDPDDESYDNIEDH